MTPNQMKLSIDSRLRRAQLAIDNALSDADIRAALLPYGYDETRLQQGKALYDSTMALQRTQEVEYSEQYAATAEFKKLFGTADVAYMDAVKIARIALRDNTAGWQALELNGKRKESLAGWLRQAQQFFVNALGNADVVTAMSHFGFDQVKLQAAFDQVNAVAAANAAQQKEKGEAQQATKQRDAALDDLEQWLADFKVVAMIALRDHPQWIEKLGLAVVA
ncbi:hypothetical protein EH223_07250 [candidate division KSB1 bacterium]|nr:MAG: hypothetical protein EH223_07250 [candidate division KSB1 bacterium]